MKFKHFLNENKERKFKVGDRVIGLKDFQAMKLVGKKGTIVNISGFNICIFWDDYLGERAWDCFGKCKNFHGWEVPNGTEYIKLLRQKGKFDKEMKVEI